jgi:hypothetical protein
MRKTTSTCDICGKKISEFKIPSIKICGENVEFCDLCDQRIAYFILAVRKPRSGYLNPSPNVRYIATSALDEVHRAATPELAKFQKSARRGQRPKKEVRND